MFNRAKAVLAGILVLGVMAPALTEGAIIQWTGYGGTPLSETRSRVFSAGDWDGVNHLQVTCDDTFAYATGQVINPNGIVLVYFFWDNDDRVLYTSTDGFGWTSAPIPDFDQDFLCNPTFF